MDWGSILSNTAAYILSPETIAYALAALGLAVHFGYTGLLNFGQAGFMAIAGYARAEDIIVTLKDNRQAVYEQARLESKARMTARLARRGIVVS